MHKFALNSNLQSQSIAVVHKTWTFTLIEKNITDYNTRIMMLDLNF